MLKNDTRPVRYMYLWPKLPGFAHKNTIIWCESVLSRQVGGLTKEVNYRGKLSVPEKLALNNRWPLIGVASQNRYDCTDNLFFSSIPVNLVFPWTYVISVKSAAFMTVYHL